MALLPHTFTVADGTTYRVDLIAGPDELPLLPEDETKQHALKITRLSDQDWRKVRMSVGGQWAVAAEGTAKATGLPAPTREDYQRLYLLEIERNLDEIWAGPQSNTYH